MEILQHLSAQIWHSIELPHKHRIVDVWPLDEKNWPSIALANHNVFRLDANNEVIWQVQREENGCVDWESRNRHAKEKDPTAEGYFDPFWTLGLDEGRAQSSVPKGVYRQGCAIYVATHWWVYRLDPETGVASCTGDQVK